MIIPMQSVNKMWWQLRKEHPKVKNYATFCAYLLEHYNCTVSEIPRNHEDVWEPRKFQFEFEDESDQMIMNLTFGDLIE